MAATLLLLFALGCDDRPASAPSPPPPPGPADPCEEGAAAVECVASTAHFCDAERRTERTEDCAAADLECQPGRGCITCRPGTVACDGQTPRVCNADGSARTPTTACDPAAGEHCSPGGCANLCARAAESLSYIGCEYWPTVTLNSQLAPEFSFAVVVANPQLVPAAVTVTRGGSEIASVTVPPNELATVELPWVDALRGVFSAERSLVVRAGAYRLVSDVPVTVYQFNPLHYRLDHDCAAEPEGLGGDGECFSFTNDASLLLPTHALTGSYLGISRATMTLRIVSPDVAIRSASPGFVAITAVRDGTTVEVVSSAFTAGSDEVPAMVPGDEASFTLDRGDVLQLVSGTPLSCPGEPVQEVTGDQTVDYCPLGPQYDLTGTEIRADAPVTVVGGHNCAFVPFDRWACDHVEEVLFPVTAWGRDVLVAPSAALREEPNLVRVVSAAANNDIRFEPAIEPPFVLSRGEFRELRLDEGVRVLGSEPLSVVQFLVGQDFAGRGTSGLRGNGDPSMSLGIPTEQFRTEYTFLTPDTYRLGYVNVVAPATSRVVLDGAIVEGFTAIGDTGAAAVNVRLEPGVHRVEGTAPFGVVVYGFGAYTSYMYPGGLDLREIAPPI